MDSTLYDRIGRNPEDITNQSARSSSHVDAYFSADVETDGPIPGPFSVLSFALVFAGSFDRSHFQRPRDAGDHQCRVAPGGCAAGTSLFA
jgi:hypothetical protein